MKRDIDAFFETYEAILTKHQFKPQFIFNCDETMVDFNNSGGKAIVNCDSPPQYVGKQGMSEHITLLLFVSAVGEMLTPLVILPLQTLPEFEEDVRKRLNFAGQPAGWIDKDILREIIQNGFVTEIEKLRAKENAPDEPALLILDNHSSRNALDAKMLWEDHKIMVLCLPAHSSHLLQPLDLGVNSVFKRQLGDRFEVIAGEDARSKRSRLMRAIVRSLQHISSGLIIGAWEKSGLWPPNSQAISQSSFKVNPSPEDPTRKRKRGLDMSKGRVLYGGEIMNVDGNNVSL